MRLSIRMPFLLITACFVVVGAYFGRNFTLPWGWGELGYVGAGAVAATPMLMALWLALLDLHFPSRAQQPWGVVLVVPCAAVFYMLYTGVAAESDHSGGWEGYLRDLGIPALLVSHLWVVALVGRWFFGNRTTLGLASPAKVSASEG